MSKQSSYPVRDFQEDWSYFLYVFCKPFKAKARCHLVHKADNYPYWSSKPTHSCGEQGHNGFDSVVHRFYLIGRSLYKIPVSYQQFYDWFIHDKWFYGEEDWRQRRRRAYSKREHRYLSYSPEYYHRQKRGYVRRPHHQPKELSDEEKNRREWRKKKKERDYRKSQRSNRSKQIASEIANPHVKARNKMLMKQERYDEIYPEYDKTVWKDILWTLD